MPDGAAPACPARCLSGWSGQEGAARAGARGELLAPGRVWVRVRACPCFRGPPSRGPAGPREGPAAR